MKHSSENGNVFFIILVAIALLVSLSYAVTQSNQGSVKAVSDEKARLYATEILEYAGIVSKAVAMLRLRGCLETEISFENDTVAGYTNGTNTACQIFHPSGGGISWNIPQAEALASTTAPNDAWGIYDGHEIVNIGTSGGSNENVDLILVLNNINLETCLKLNDLLSITNPSNTPPNTIETADDKFTGSYNADFVINDSPLLGMKSACLEDLASDYKFYKVLIAR